MSLINDALKRAKEVQSNHPPPAADNLQLRPIDSGSQPRRGIGLVLPATAITIALAALFSVWQLNGRNHTPVSVGPVTTVRLAAANPQQSKPAPERVDISAAAVESTTPSISTNVPVQAQDASRTNAIALAQAGPPKPAPPQLRAIIFNPTRPSALINGKTVFVGDKVGEFHVTAITPMSATLASATQTNTLTLE